MFGQGVGMIVASSVWFWFVFTGVIDNLVLVDKGCFQSLKGEYHCDPMGF